MIVWGGSVFSDGGGAKSHGDGIVRGDVTSDGSRSVDVD